MKAIKKITMIAALLLGTITCIAQVKYYYNPLAELN